MFCGVGGHSFTTLHGHHDARADPLPTKLLTFSKLLARNNWWIHSHVLLGCRWCPRYLHLSSTILMLHLFVKVSLNTQLCSASCPRCKNCWWQDGTHSGTFIRRRDSPDCAGGLTVPGSIGRMNPWFKKGKEKESSSSLCVFGDVWGTVYLWIAKRYVKWCKDIFIEIS